MAIKNVSVLDFESWEVNHVELFSMGKDNLLVKKIDTDRFLSVLYHNDKKYTKELNSIQLRSLFTESLF